MRIAPSAFAALVLAVSVGRECRAQDAPAQSSRAADPAAQDPSAPVVPARAPGNLETWTIKFEPLAWYASPGGHVELPNSTLGQVRVDDLNLDSPRLTPFGELHVRNGNFGVTIGGFAFDMDDRGAIAEESGTMGGVAFSVGDRLVTSLSFVSAEAVAAYRFYEHPRGDRAAGGVALRPTWEFIFGGRVYDIDLDIAAPGGFTSQSTFMVEPIAGLRFSMDLIETFSLDITGSFGYFSDGRDRQSVSWDIAAGFQWNPTRSLGLQIGYRQLAFNLHDGAGNGEFDFGGAMAGLFFGGVLRF